MVRFFQQSFLLLYLSSHQEISDGEHQEALSSLRDQNIVATGKKTITYGFPATHSVCLFRPAQKTIKCFLPGPLASGLCFAFLSPNSKEAHFFVP